MRGATLLGTDPYIGAQILTLAIPLGVFVAGLLWLFFQRRRQHP